MEQLAFRWPFCIDPWKFLLMCNHEPETSCPVRCRFARTGEEILQLQNPKEDCNYSAYQSASQSVNAAKRARPSVMLLVLGVFCAEFTCLRCKKSRSRPGTLEPRTLELEMAISRKMRSVRRCESRETCCGWATCYTSW